jgi:signal peptidase I
MLYVRRWGQILRQKEPWRWAITILIAALVGIAAGHTVLGSMGSISVVDGLSMYPTYQPGARVFTCPISTAICRGDVVLVDDGAKEYALKRIVGMPGDTIQFCRGYVFINRKMLKEPYLPKYTYTFPAEHCKTGIVHLRDDQYFVLGDNRTISQDSRVYGPVERAKIKSRVPAPQGVVQASFAKYTLPSEGKRTIQPVP